MRSRSKYALYNPHKSQTPNWTLPALCSRVRFRTRGFILSNDAAGISTTPGIFVYRPPWVKLGRRSATKKPKMKSISQRKTSLSS
jgi:hypothetical protein